jgi:Holliday junction resolvasome RuvABC DNA-binding subunit
MVESPAFSDALGALVSLGYKRAEAKRALLVVLSREPDASNAEVMVKEALREL